MPFPCPFLLRGGRLGAGAHLGEGHVGKLVHLQPGLLPWAVVELTLEDAGRRHRGDAHPCGGGWGTGVRGAQSLGLPASPISSLGHPELPRVRCQGRLSSGHQSMTGWSLSSFSPETLGVHSPALPSSSTCPQGPSLYNTATFTSAWLPWPPSSPSLWPPGLTISKEHDDILSHVGVESLKPQGIFQGLLSLVSPV